MNIPFQQTDGGSPAHEHNDCAVRAIAVAANLPYTKAHALLHRGGRRTGHKFKFSSWMGRQKRIGVYRLFPVRLYEDAPTLTLNQFVKSNIPGRYIVRISGHVFAIIDGVVHDETLRGGKSRITCIWKLEAL